MSGIEAGQQWTIPDGTVSLLFAIAARPDVAVGCSLAPGEPALAVYHTPQGCAARPDDRFQALCWNHIETDGLRDGAEPVLDLTIDGAWSREAGLQLPLKLGYSVAQLEVFLAELSQS